MYKAMERAFPAGTSQPMTFLVEREGGQATAFIFLVALGIDYRIWWPSGPGGGAHAIGEQPAPEEPAPEPARAA
jgi:hypothetical protein